MKQSELQLSHEPGPDVFDMNLLPGETGSGTPAPPKPDSKPPRPAKVSLAARIGLPHFGAVALLVAAAWIMWPDAPHTGKRSALVPPVRTVEATAELQRTQPTVLPPSPAPATATAAPASPMPPGMPVQADTTASESPASPAMPTTAPLPPAASVIEQQAAQATAMIEAIDAVNRRLLALEQRLAAMPGASGSSAPRESTRTTASVAQHRRVARHRNDREPPAAPGNYRLNTIFRGQAWIADGETVHVVGAGDTLGSMTIVRIDPAARRVLTDRGAIR